MSSTGAFVLPAGVSLSHDDGRLSIAHDGDVVVEAVPEGGLARIEAGGDVTLRSGGAVQLESIQAGGTVTLAGSVKATSIVGAVVALESGSFKAEVVRGTRSVQIGKVKLEASVVTAPSVTIDAGARGRATAIQSGSDVGSHKLKGGFSLGEFVELMPGGAELLQRHGIEVPDEDEDELEVSVMEDSEPEPEPEAETAPVEDEAPTAPPVPAEVRTGVTDALGKIQAAYAGGDVPPPIARLVELVEGGNYSDLKMSINGIWSDLLKYHQQTGLYISNAVTHMFQSIQLLMRKVD